MLEFLAEPRTLDEMMRHRFIYRPHVDHIFANAAERRTAFLHVQRMLARGEAAAVMDIPLGPEIGQCCGGRVTLALDRGPATPPPPGPEVLIFGAGHVGRALARALLPLPLRPRLIDSRAEELALAEGLPATLSPIPEAEIRRAGSGAAFVVMTHDHALDFLIAAEALARSDAAYVGMIGSRSKRASFDRHAARIRVDAARLVCPIAPGAPRDKRPAVIAAFAAAEIMAAVQRVGAPVATVDGLYDLRGLATALRAAG